MKDSGYQKTIDDNLKKCVRCGLCLGVCPVYSVDREESSSPRGRIHTIDKIKNRDIFKKFLNNCLLCGSCRDVCPNDVDIHNVIRSVRLSEGLARNIYLILRAMQGTDFSKMKIISSLMNTERNSGGLIRFLNLKRHIPKISADRVLYNNILADKNVAVFTGCIAPLFYPEVINGISAFYMNKGYNVYIPENQVCCGLMNYSAGDGKKALGLSSENIKLFSSEKIEKIITPCASCAYMFHQYAELVKDGKELSAKIFTFEDFILERIQTALSENNIALHIPCHIRNSDDKSLYKRLKKFRNVRIIDSCCGYGGVFNLYEYDKSVKIGERLLGDLKDKKVLYTLCSGCYMQLFDIVRKNGISTEVRNLAELI